MNAFHSWTGDWWDELLMYVFGFISLIKDSVCNHYTLHSTHRQLIHPTIYVFSSIEYFHPNCYNSYSAECLFYNNVQSLIDLSTRFPGPILWRPQTMTMTATAITRKLCYRKNDRAMRPIYERLEKFRDSLPTPTAIFPKIFMGFSSDWPCEYAYRIWSPQL